MEKKTIRIACMCGFVGATLAKPISEFVKIYPKSQFVFTKKVEPDTDFVVYVSLDDPHKDELVLKELWDTAIVGKNFAKERLIIFESFRGHFEKQLTLPVFIGVDDARTMFALVREGLGVGFCFAEHMDELQPHGITAIDLVEVLPELKLPKSRVVLKPLTQTPFVRKFLWICEGSS